MYMHPTKKGGGNGTRGIEVCMSFLLPLRKWSNASPERVWNLPKLSSSLDFLTLWSWVLAPTPPCFPDACGVTLIFPVDLIILEDLGRGSPFKTCVVFPRIIQSPFYEINSCVLEVGRKYPTIPVLECK